MLKEMFDKQKELQKRLKVKFDQGYINTMTLACIDELMEALHETPWKPWKKQQDRKEEEFKNEIIDAQHFIINLALAAGMDEKEFYERFCSKNKLNHKRQDNDY